MGCLQFSRSKLSCEFSSQVLVTRRQGVMEQRLVDNLKRVLQEGEAQIVLSSDWRRFEWIALQIELHDCSAKVARRATRVQEGAARQWDGLHRVHPVYECHGVLHVTTPWGCRRAGNCVPRQMCFGTWYQHPHHFHALALSYFHAALHMA